MGDHNGSRYVKKYLDERQQKSFKTMYENPEYENRQIRERFGVSDSVITELAHQLGCKMRKGRT